MTDSLQYSADGPIDPAFAEIVAKLGITFIGPSADAMRLLGDKVAAKILAEKVGVPVAPWSGGPVETRADARRHAQSIGYPLIDPLPRRLHFAIAQ